MKRRLLIAAVFLLAGAVVNVAVAWGCGISSADLGGYDAIYPPRKKWVAWWTDHAPQGFVSEPTPVDNSVPLFYAIGTTEFGTSTMTFKDTVAPYQRVTRLRSGLPMPSMEGAVWFNSRSVWPIYDAAIKLPHDDELSPTLLLRPIWPGFAVNTVFYAMVLWLLIPGPFVLRRFIRVKRGLCSACAYPIGESDVCSECGKALPRRMKVAT